MDSAEAIVLITQIWGGAGALVALIFLAYGIDRVDEDARGAYVFRPLLVPGILLIWPLVLLRWWQIENDVSPWMSRYRPVRAGHGLAALIMAFCIVLALLMGLAARQVWPAHIAPQQVEGSGQ